MELYSEFGEIVEVYIPMNRETGNGRGFAFVTMKTEDADRAIEETNGIDYQGRNLVVSVPLREYLRSSPFDFDMDYLHQTIISHTFPTFLSHSFMFAFLAAPGQKAPPRRQSVPRLKLYIGNLSFYTVAETLSDLFSEFGVVHDCYLPEDPSSGGSRGFGFVTMDKEDAQRAIEELDGCEIDGRIIRVNEAQPKRAPRKDFDMPPSVDEDAEVEL